MQAKPAPLWPWMLTCAAAAICIDLGNFHRLDHADAILPVLNSLYRWTPFYWGQDRLGQLLPLIARPCSHPLVNLLVQSALSIFSGLAAMFLLPRYLQRDAGWPITGTALVALFLVFAPPRFQFDFLAGCQPYAVSLALSLAGMIVLENHARRGYAAGRLAAALALMILAHWVSPTSAWVLIPLVVLRYWFRQIERGECVAAVSALAAACAISIAASLAVRTLHLYHHEKHVTSGEIADPRLWLDMWWRLTVNLWLSIGWFGPAAILVTGVAVLAAWCLPGGRAALRSSFRLLPPTLLASAVYAAVTGSLSWVRYNDFSCRYWLPVFFVALGGVASACWIPAGTPLWQALAARAWGRRIMVCSLTAAVLSAAVWSYGPPSLAAVRRDIDANCGRLTPDIRTAGCTHIVGDYWKVWPAMFHANLVAYERGESQIIWGDTDRATILQDLWNQIPPRDIKLAIAAGDDSTDIWDSVFDLAEMSRVRQGAIDVLEPAEVFALWMHGFMRHESRATDRRGQPSGALWICNRTNVPHEVELCFSLHKETGRPFPLVISSPWFSERLELEAEPLGCRHFFEVPPGKHLVQFQCENPRFQKGGLVLQWAYCVDGPQLALMSKTRSPSASNIRGYKTSPQ